MSDELRDLLETVIARTLQVNGVALLGNLAMDPPNPDNVCMVLAKAILREFDVGLRQTLTPDAAESPPLKFPFCPRCGHAASEHPRTDGGDGFTCSIALNEPPSCAACATPDLREQLIDLFNTDDVPAISRAFGKGIAAIIELDRLRGEDPVSDRTETRAKLREEIARALAEHYGEEIEKAFVGQAAPEWLSEPGKIEYAQADALIARGLSAFGSPPGMTATTTRDSLIEETVRVLAGVDWPFDRDASAAVCARAAFEAAEALLGAGVLAAHEETQTP